MGALRVTIKGKASNKSILKISTGKKTIDMDEHRD